jgi:hypothetical protein
MSSEDYNKAEASLSYNPSDGDFMLDTETGMMYVGAKDNPGTCYSFKVQRKDNGKDGTTVGKLTYTWEYSVNDGNWETISSTSDFARDGRIVSLIDMSSDNKYENPGSLLRVRVLNNEVDSTTVSYKCTITNKIGPYSGQTSEQSTSYCFVVVGNKFPTVKDETTATN